MIAISKFVLLVLASLLAISAVAFASVVQIPMRSELRFHPFSNIPQPQFGYADGATVSVEVGCAPGFDQLLFNYQGNFQIDNSYDKQRCTLYLVGQATIAEYIDAISTVVFYTTKEDFQPRRVTWTLGKGTFYNSLTGHFYRFQPFIGAWADAFKQCNETKPLGMNGYLATITSNEEMVGIGSKTNMSLWTGLMADPNTIGQGMTTNWKWGAGPEMGWSQWTGNSMYEGGMPANTKVGPAFTAWGRFQPTDLTSAVTSERQYVAIVPSKYENVASWQNLANTDGVQGYVCEYDDIFNPTIASEMQKWAGSVLLEFSCGNYSGQAACTNRAAFGCSYSANVCQQTQCTVHATSKDCYGDSRCQWNTDGLLGRCVNRHCTAYSSTPTCQADPTCTADLSGGVATCRDAVCTDARDSCTCAKIDGCSWRNSKCGLQDTIGCDGMDVVYIFDASSAVDRQFQQFTGGFQALTDMLLSSQFYLTGTRAGVDPTGMAGMRVGFVRFSNRAQTQVRGQGSSGQLTGDAAEALADLTYLQQNFAPSPIRALDPALQAAETMFKLSGTRAQTIVIITAGDISDASSLQNTPTSSYNRLVAAGVKIVAAAIRPQFPPSIDTLNTQASLMTLFGAANANNYVSTIMSRIKADGIYAICDIGTTLGTTVASVGRRDLCKHSLTPDSCSANPVCAWSFSAGMCVTSQCLNNCNASTCSNDPTCFYQTGKSTCEELCPAQASVSDCNSKGIFCYWNATSSQCKSQPCYSNPTEDACIADNNGCYYNASSPVKCKPIECNFDSSTDCLSTANIGTCSWNNKAGVCFRDACKIAGTNAQLCKQNAECKFADNGQCQLHACANSRTETQCNFDFNCFWDITQSPPACMPGDCVSFNQDPLSAQQKCATMPNKCAWVPGTGGNADRCEVIQCGMISTSCGCAKLSQCVWRNDQCKDSRYVQCPAIDVIFAVEGTPEMSKPFQRHPSGFIGIVESIRSWSRDAPMTTNASLTGFRMGISAYGPLKTPWVVSSGVGAGNDLTGDPTQWVDADRMLSDIENTQLNDALFAGTDVAILPVLKNAQTIFESHQKDPARTKMLVIIGNSPITDGGAAVREQIKILEGMGVQIFTNLIRRFSSITPLDTQAAEFLMPVSSDAMSAHFLFTTIDDLRATLLDKFCDPSTNTGKALQVSRDRTLPCNWLSGQRECNLQGSCFWNASALPTCPNSDQCPNLGCVALPATLKKKFSCKQCQLKNGAFSCSYSNNFAPTPGLCVTATCMLNCGTANCNSDSACTWKADNTRCERNWCSSYTDLTTCDADLGCVWDEFNPDGSPAASGRCRQGTCWANRAYGSCTTQAVRDAGGNRPTCLFLDQYSPAVCTERRCDALQQSDCNSLPSICKFDPSSQGRACQHLECAYTSGEECELDSLCFWDPYGQRCNKRTPDCKVTAFSKWSACTSQCGNGITFRARRIIQYPDGSADAISCPVAISSMGDVNAMVQTLNCKNVTEYKANWMDSCTDFCAQYNTDVGACVRNMNCNWVSVGTSASCQPKSSIGCESIRDKDTCASSDMCQWSTELDFCLPAVTQCRYTDLESCTRISNCAWRTGSNSFTVAAGYGIDVALYNPGQPAMFVFPTLSFPSADASTTMIVSASVMIESNYQAGKDKLDLSLPSSMQIQWVPSSGMLVLTGQASVADYANAISLVTFQTTSTRTNPRTITYSLGARVASSSASNTTSGVTSSKIVYSAVSSHSYIQYTTSGTVTYDQAAYACLNTMLHGRGGYLATVRSEEENDVISTKLEGKGWLGADDASGRWKWSQGPTPDMNTFWVGGSSLGSGVVVSGQFVNWYVNDGEPTNDDFARQRALYLDQNSYWYAKRTSDTMTSYVCEYGGLASDMPLDYPLGGSRVLGAGGCVPPMCSWHINRANCTADAECEWSSDSGSCKTGCLSRSTASECSSSTTCFWDISTFPATCQRDPCGGLGYKSCASNTKCMWDSNGPKCSLKTGCPAIEGKADCDRSKTCQWFDNMGGCVTKPCTSLTDALTCGANPLCDWVSGACSSALCKATDASTCMNDKACTWSDPMQAGFIPGGDAIHPFAESYFPPNDATTFIDGVTIRITQGYHQNLDVLSADPVSQMRSKFTTVWIPLYGTLLLTAAYATNPVTALEAYNLIKKYVSFQTTSTRPNPRQFVVTFGLAAAQSPTANPNVTKILKQVDQNTIYPSMAAAQARCANTTYFGARGILAEPRTENENLGLRSVQARGWIGASATGSSWTWNSDGLSFWTLANGLGAPVPLASPTAAQTYEFAQWSSGQPTASATGAMVVNEGFWISLNGASNTLLRGVVCEYHSNEMHIENFYGIAFASPKGCYPMPCAGLPRPLCQQDTSCIWGSIGGSQEVCYQDSWCAQHPSPAQCQSYASCYWDHGLATCAVSPASACDGLDTTECPKVTGCGWNSLLIPKPGAPVGTNSKGACVATGCAIHPTSSSCFSDPLCRWYTTDSSPQGVCIERLCGYITQTACWMDSKCVWNPTQVKCVKSECIGSSQTDCGNLAACKWDTTKGQCLWERCSSRIDISTTQGFDMCLWDPTCLAKKGTGCTKPSCNIAVQADCNKNPDCFYFSTATAGGAADGYCSAAQCTSQSTETGCGGSQASDPCRWDANTGCRQASPEEMAPKEYCVRQIDPDLTWLYVFIVIILLLLVGILYRVYLAYSKGLNFFDPARKNIKFNAHSTYAAELYNFAQEGGVEENNLQQQQEHQQHDQVGNDEGDYGAYNDEDEHPDL